MPTYRVIINGEPSETVVTGASYIDAYFLAAQAVPQAYKKDFKLEKEESE